MAKKSKSRKKSKQRKPNVPVYTTPSKSQEDVSSQAAPAAATAAPQATAATSTAQLTGDASLDTINWPKEYPYFIPDMKRLGIVVAIMVVILLALNFVFIYML